MVSARTQFRLPDPEAPTVEIIVGLDHGRFNFRISHGIPGRLLPAEKTAIQGFDAGVAEIGLHDRPERNMDLIDEGDRAGHVKLQPLGLEMDTGLLANLPDRALDERFTALKESTRYSP